MDQRVGTSKTNEKQMILTKHLLTNGEFSTMVDSMNSLLNCDFMTETKKSMQI